MRAFLERDCGEGGLVLAGLPGMDLNMIVIHSIIFVDIRHSCFQYLLEGRGLDSLGSEAAPEGSPSRSSSSPGRNPPELLDLAANTSTTSQVGLRRAV